MNLEHFGVFNSGQDESSYFNPNPFGVKITSNTLGSSPEFDIRDIWDVLLLTAVSKVGLTAMSTVTSPRAKALVGATTIASIGTVGAGFKLINQARHNLRSLNEPLDVTINDRPASPSNDNFTTNSPLENLSSSSPPRWHPPHLVGGDARGFFLGVTPNPEGGGATKKKFGAKV